MSSDSSERTNPPENQEGQELLNQLILDIGNVLCTHLSNHAKAELDSETRPAEEIIKGLAGNCLILGALISNDLREIALSKLRGVKRITEIEINQIADELLMRLNLILEKRGISSKIRRILH